MKILSIDYGTKRVGLAISDETLTFAHRIAHIENFKDENELLIKLAKIIEFEQVDEVIIGLPLGVDEKDTEMSKKIQMFIQTLKTVIKSSVKTVNETYTTRQAYSNLGRNRGKKSIDSESARILLQEYLDDKKLRASTQDKL
ncbi:MAG: Holliday junction resolvase RuvX [Candidatus Dojkabacteria bacterium]